jgi:hypothetical protein
LAALVAAVGGALAGIELLDDGLISVAPRVGGGVQDELRVYNYGQRIGGKKDAGLERFEAKFAARTRLGLARRPLLPGGFRQCCLCAIFRPA